MKRTRILRTVILLALLCVYVQLSYGYLDPGTGSMLLAVIAGIVSTLLYTIRGLLLKVRLLVTRQDAQNNSAMNNIVFYSEGSQYWNTFKDTVEALVAQQVHLSYLSSDINDPGLKYQSEYVHSKYIGKGNKAYTYLNLMTANICVLTTPNLDTLQIRRSKNVRHYCHILHAPTDMHLYKLFAFDFYDSILISGPHQEKSIRHLEQLRHTPPKTLYPVGCPYIDVLREKKTKHSPVQSTSSKSPSILMAPTWGESGLLYQGGEEIISSLISSGYTIIVRPHPQSLIVEKEMIEELQQKFAKENIVWDTNPDNFASMTQADFLLSERSGIIFDFAFVFEKPVITYEAEVVLKGTDGNDIPWPAWELDILSKIGVTVSQKQLTNIGEIIDRCRNNQAQYINNIRQLRDEYLYHFGKSGEQAAKTLMDISEKIGSGE